MKPIYLTLENDRSLMLVPDTDAHLDGHPVITRTYGIYKDGRDKSEQQMANIESELHLRKKHNINYLGELVIELPQRVYHYVDDGNERLKPMEVRDIVAKLNSYLGDPSLWSIKKL